MKVSELKVGMRVYVQPSEYMNDWANGWGVIEDIAIEDCLVSFERSSKEYWFHEQRLSLTAPIGKSFNDPQPIGC